jgi:hypothetical protein
LVGEVGWQIPSTQMKATGRGDYCRTNLDRHGFLRGYYTRAKRVRGFQSGDMVPAEVPKGASYAESRIMPSIGSLAAEGRCF